MVRHPSPGLPSPKQVRAFLVQRDEDRLGLRDFHELAGGLIQRGVIDEGDAAGRGGLVAVGLDNGGAAVLGLYLLTR